MVIKSRTRFIFQATVAYAAFSLAWIFLSDKLLAGFSNVDSLLWLSTVKGIFYVAISTAMFLLAMGSVPPAHPVNADANGATAVFGTTPAPHARWLSFLFAVAMPISLLLLRSSLSDGLAERPLMIMLMLPIIASALLGGLWPGVVCTAISALGIDYTALTPLHSLSIDKDIDRLQWAFLIGNGLAVSLLSEKLRQTLAKTQAQRTLLNAVISGTSDAVFVKDRNGRYLMINDAGAHMVGKPVDDILGHDDSTLFPADTAKLLMTNDRAVMEAAANHTYEEPLITEGGQAFVLLVTKGPILGAHGQIIGLFGISRDITLRKKAELALHEAAMVFDSSYEGIMVVDSDRKISKVNPAFARITGYTAREAIGQPASMLSSRRQGAEFYATLWQSLADEGFWRGEIWNRRKNGEIYAELLSISVVRDAGGHVQHYIGVFWDLTDVKAHEAELDHVANYDSLTGSPNRRLLANKMDHTIEHAKRSGKSMAVCFIDLDSFKLINDQHGAVVGDKMLIGVAENLKHVLRANDTLARLGGDEFVLLLSDLASAEEGALILERVLAAVCKPVQIGDDLISVSGSVGVSLYPQDNGDADTLLRHADQTMLLAKEAGKNRYQLFDPESHRRAQSHRQYLDQLAEALENKQFVLYYQPKVDLLSGEIFGVEALIRWQHPQRGLTSPAEFLPTIEGSLLEKPLGEWVIDTALAQASAWLATGLSIRISVNISARHLLQPDFHSRLKIALERQSTVKPAMFELEILESAAIGDIDQAINVLQQCRGLGVHSSLDDFGTGYSSLTHLRRLPVDMLKIDQSFVRAMLDNPDDLGIVEGVIRLAGAFNRQVIAEGVESMAHGAALLKLGCRLAQGYGIARPMAASEFAAWSAQWKLQQIWLDLKT